MSNEKITKIGKLRNFEIFPYMIGDKVNCRKFYEIGGFEIIQRTTFLDDFLELKAIVFSESRKYSGINVEQIRIRYDSFGKIRFEVNLGAQGQAMLLMNESEIECLEFAKGEIQRDYLQERAIYALCEGIAYELLQMKDLPNSFKTKSLEELAADYTLSMFFELKNK